MPRTRHLPTCSCRWFALGAISPSGVVPSICLLVRTRGAQLVFGFVLSPPVLLDLTSSYTVLYDWFSVVVSLLFSSHRLASDTSFCRFRLFVCFLCVCDLSPFMSAVLFVPCIIIVFPFLCLRL